MDKEVLKNLNRYCRLRVRFFASVEVADRYWIGAVLRNRFLHAADSVTDSQGISLRRIIDTLPLPDNHFLYRQLKGGFPKGFFLDCSDLPFDYKGFCFEADRIYTFSIVLIGNMNEYKPMYMDAVKKMLGSGFGHPVVPMTVVDIIEEEHSVAPLYEYSEESVDLQLVFKTPVCLVRVSKEGGGGFQNKLNNFPSFYQFMRSLMYRLVTLSILYGGSRRFESLDEMEEWIEQSISSSYQAMLLRANLFYMRLLGTPKVGDNTVYSMGGYSGRLIFGNVPAALLPVLHAGAQVGVGADINYGLGQFCFDYKVKK